MVTQVCLLWVVFLVIGAVIILIKEMPLSTVPFVGCALHCQPSVSSYRFLLLWLKDHLTKGGWGVNNYITAECNITEIVHSLIPTVEFGGFLSWKVKVFINSVLLRI